MMRKLVLSPGIFLFALLFLEEIQLCFSTNSTLGWIEGERRALMKLKQNFKDPLGRNSTFGCIEEERRALQKLKQSFEDPSNRLASWTGKDCCQWRGVRCDKRSSAHVIKLDLRSLPSYHSTSFIGLYYDYNSLEQLFAAEVDSCLSELKHLSYLDLSGNNFSQSPIPKFFGSMKHLKYLNLSNANFSGMIPHQLGNLTRLRVLDLNHESSFSLLVSDSFQWASSLVSLQHLEMSIIDLRRALDLMNMLSGLPSLRHLRLEGCGISNDHFSRCSANSSSCLASLRFLSLRVNVLGGETLEYFHNMTALRELDLGYNYGIVTKDFRWASSLLSLQRLDMTGADLSMALDLVQVVGEKKPPK